MSTLVRTSFPARASLCLSPTRRLVKLPLARPASVSQIRSFWFRRNRHGDHYGIWKDHVLRKDMDGITRKMADDMQFLLRYIKSLESTRGEDKDTARMMGRQLRQFIDDIERDVNPEQKQQGEAGWQRPGHNSRSCTGGGRGAGSTETWRHSSTKSTHSSSPPPASHGGDTIVETVEYIDPITNRKIMVPQAPEPGSKWKEVEQNREKETDGEQELSGKRVTGNYVKDFPEDFRGSWAQQYMSDEGPGAASMDESFPPLEPALDRPDKAKSSESVETEVAAAKGKKAQQIQPAEDQEADQVKILKGKDLEKELKAIYEETYGKIEEEPILSSSLKPTPDPNPELASDAEYAATPPESSLYKILAIDPSTQQIQTADATSIAADTHPPLTVVDVMQRLSNPSKFFPHFEPLQSQGYEIISGSGDVLVFRKVRAATEPGTVFLRGATKPRNADPESRPVNPIDMMGSAPIVPNIGNFASPTGYVNYDSYTLPDEVKQPKPKPPPPFRSMIDVRREEEVFSGWKAPPKQKWWGWWRSVWRDMPGSFVFVLGFFTGGFSLILWSKAMLERTRRRRLAEGSESEKRVLDGTVAPTPWKGGGPYEKGGLARYSYPPAEEQKTRRWW